MGGYAYFLLFTFAVTMICFAATEYYDKKHKSQSTD